MATRTIRAAKAALVLSVGILFATSSVSAQSYHRKLHSIAGVNNVMDSARTANMQVSVTQPDKSIMKFRVAVINPNGKSLTVVIRKGFDILFFETAGGEQYENLFDLTQLEDGEYEVLITAGKEKIARTINMHTETEVRHEASVN